MKALKEIIAFFILCILCCSGIISCLRNSSPDIAVSPSPTSLSSMGSPTAPSVAFTPDPEVERVFSERMKVYEDQYKTWEGAKADLDIANADLAEIEAKIVAHEARMPIAPVFDQRKWSTIDEKYTTIATLVDTDNVKVKLKKSDDKSIEVSKDLLIAGDRIYVGQAFKEIELHTKEMATWESERKELKSRRLAIWDRIEAANAPEPKAPVRSVTEAEIFAAKRAQEKAVERAKAEADAKVRADAEKRAQAEIDTYATVLRIVDPDGNLFTNVSSKGDELIVTVSNFWHFQPYQIRLQATQDLWAGWANLHSPKDVDKSRISIVDRNGNEVGGSRVWAGSLIWVQEK